MKIISLEQFNKDYNKFYSECDNFIIKLENDTNEIIRRMYNCKNFKIDYEKKVIKVY